MMLFSNSELTSSEIGLVPIFSILEIIPDDLMPIFLYLEHSHVDSKISCIDPDHYGQPFALFNLEALQIDHITFIFNEVPLIPTFEVGPSRPVGI